MKLSLAAIGITAALTLPVFAMEVPAGPVVLTVRGVITATNNGDAAEFDLAMLGRLGGRKASLKTPWANGKLHFEGPFLRSVLEKVGAKGSRLTLRALNGYVIDVPATDAAMQTILATHRDGKPMPVRDMGPLMLVYPFDLDPTLYNETYFSRSVWQIKEIEVAR